MEKLQREWESAELGVLPYRETGTYVLKVEDALSQQLDDHIVMLGAMAFSPHKKPFEERLVKWEATLSLVGTHVCGVCHFLHAGVSLRL